MNQKYKLDFISDRNLYRHVKTTVSGYSFEMDLKKFNTNLIDPIKLTFDSIVYEQDYKDTIENEVLRQLDKTNSNLIGYFHQNIFKYPLPSRSSNLDMEGRGGGVVFLSSSSAEIDVNQNRGGKGLYG